MAKNKAKDRGESANRINTGITILPELHARLRNEAENENRTASRLLEIVLEWSLDQMRKHGLSSTQLKHYSIRIDRHDLR